MFLSNTHWPQLTVPFYSILFETSICQFNSSKFAPIMRLGFILQKIDTQDNNTVQLLWCLQHYCRKILLMTESCHGTSFECCSGKLWQIFTAEKKIQGPLIIMTVIEHMLRTICTFRCYWNFCIFFFWTPPPSVLIILDSVLMLKLNCSNKKACLIN